MQTGTGPQGPPETPILDPAAPAPTAGKAAAAPALGRTVLRGSLWMLLITGITRAASFIAQIVLGWILSQHDFGVYALAISAATVASALRDGGVRQLLIQRQNQYEQLLGPVFWMAAAFNTGTTLLILALAWPLARLFNEPMVAWLMVGIGIVNPISTPGSILNTRLQLDLRFREFGIVTGVAAIIRYLGAVGFALAGFGPLSFVLPLPFIAISDWALGWWFTRERPWRRAPQFRTWWRLFRETWWLIVGNFAYSCTILGANPILGLFAATYIVGVYFFAYQIVVQVGLLIGATLSQVLFAAFARIATDTDRKRAALARSVRQSMLLIAPTCVGLAVTFAPLELLIWRGKWADAALPVQILGLLYPPSVAAQVAYASMQARGHFRAWGLSLVAIAVGGLGGAAVGASLYGSAVAVALYSGLGSAAASMAVVLYVQRASAVGWREALGTLLPAWLLAAAAGGLALIIDIRVLAGVHPAVRLLAAGASFTALYAALARFYIPAHLAEALQALPQRARAPLASALRLRHAGPTKS